MARSPEVPEEAYRDEISARVIALRRRSDDDDLLRIVRKMKGASPEVVADVLSTCGGERSSSAPERAAAIVTRADGEVQPHPLDYDWRFTDSTLAGLSGLLAEYKRILVIGAPRVFQALAGRGVDVSLVDRNPTRSPDGDHFRNVDLFEEQRGRSENGYDAVFLDSPWYPDHLVNWIAIAAARLSKPVPIIFTIWRQLTRPTAADERCAILRLLESLGTIETWPAAVEYDTPLFEQQVLFAAGIVLSRPWRLGDLIRFQPADLRPVRVISTPMKKIAEWCRYTLGPLQLAVRVKRNTQPVAIRPLSDGSSSLKSVSRRDPLRHEIDLWTSENRVGSLSGTSRVIEALDAWSASHVQRHHEKVLQTVFDYIGDCSAAAPGRAWLQKEWTNRE